MTLYYTLVFALLMFEMGLFVVLILPLPHSVKRKLFAFISESPLVAKAQYGLKRNNNQAMLEGSGRMEVQARKFYAQRNMYLCGFTLFLSLILNRTYVMILDTLRLEEKVKRYEGDPSAKGKASEQLAQAGDAGEIGKLKKQLAAKDRDIETLKKQTNGLQNEYNRMGDNVASSDGTPKKDR
ncbi:uncharacterized protein KY384_001665 [Bacidia gigantensis]|uniref:uncharacterized protein n=1 Tax=Bacidia gigantensis TaxID=2732470 RepID=UPI001D044F79|nr:uncharacterized protein KY384_001665 [Bacidia gigantensis]KAG8533924.1 hypothetical protein KY384_001665 [Bacidia gigantensis]